MDIVAPIPTYKWALALGCLYGIWQSIVFIEGQKAFLLPVLAVGLAVLWFMLWRKQGGKFTDFARSRVMTAFVAGLIPCIFLGMLAYFLIFGGFPEPSTLE